MQWFIPTEGGTGDATTKFCSHSLTEVQEDGARPPSLREEPSPPRRPTCYRLQVAVTTIWPDIVLWSTKSLNGAVGGRFLESLVQERRDEGWRAWWFLADLSRVSTALAVRSELLAGGGGTRLASVMEQARGGKLEARSRGAVSLTGQCRG